MIFSKLLSFLAQISWSTNVGRKITKRFCKLNPCGKCKRFFYCIFGYFLIFLIHSHKKLKVLLNFFIDCFKLREFIICIHHLINEMFNIPCNIFFLNCHNLQIRGNCLSIHFFKRLHHGSNC